jgi:hypothetical protein
LFDDVRHLAHEGIEIVVHAQERPVSRRGGARGGRARSLCPVPADNAAVAPCECSRMGDVYKSLRSFWDAAQKEWPVTGQSRLLSVRGG